VLLTCKESELKSSRDQNLHELEPYYCGGQSSLVSHQEIACKEDLKNKHFISRMIIHPHYENMTQNQAVEVSYFDVSCPINLVTLSLEF
jgi:transcription elongation factor SPT6